MLDCGSAAVNGPAAAGASTQTTVFTPVGVAAISSNARVADPEEGRGWAPIDLCTGTASSEQDFTLAQLRQKVSTGELRWGTIVVRRADELHLPLGPELNSRKDLFWAGADLQPARCAAAAGAAGTAATGAAAAGEKGKGKGGGGGGGRARGTAETAAAAAAGGGQTAWSPSSVVPGLRAAAKQALLQTPTALQVC